MTPNEINALAAQVYAQNCQVGWWDDPNRCPLQTLMLVVTEVAEATEGDRKDLMDDHLPHRKMAEVELADTFIRLVDLAGRYGWEYKQTEETQGHSILGKCSNLAARHLAIVAAVGDIALAITDCDTAAGHVINYYYRKAMTTVLQVARIEGYDLRGAIDEKLAYNAKRADHKRENRAKPGGKGY